ncbi:hypothetical protein ABZY45_13340 [Streptomyces sp. NPDC006516]|uniref:hypothetical protein n=1 Tax=Streptomyces sp. NPDC006516 TaxID=3154309 RepID=UPI0033A24C54
MDRLGLLDVLQREQVALRIHDDAFSALAPTARHPRTGELLSTVKFMVQSPAAAGELQRDLQRELTYDGMRAAEAMGSKGGRRPAVAAANTAAVRTAYLEGRSIAALARDHGVSRGAISMAVADLRSEYPAVAESPLRLVQRLVRVGEPGLPRELGDVLVLVGESGEAARLVTAFRDCATLIDLRQGGRHG